MSVSMRACSVIATLVAGSLVAADWPQWRGPERDGISREKGLMADWSQPPRQAWQASLGGRGYTPPAVVGDTVYIAGLVSSNRVRTGVLYAIHAATGAIRWQCPYGSEWNGSYDSARTTPTIVGDHAYLISGAGVVVCVRLADGTIAWSVDTQQRFKGRNIQWGVAESPLVADGLVICHPGGPDAAVAALDAATGATRWTTKGINDASAYCSPALLTLNGRRQIVTQTENSVLGIDPATGEVVWKFAHRNRYAVHANTPVAVAADKVVVSSGYGYGTECLQLGTAGVSRVWQLAEADCHFHGMLSIGGRLYLTGSNGLLYVLDPVNGAVLSRLEIGKAGILGTTAGILAYSEKYKGQGQVLQIACEGDACRVTGAFPVAFGKGEHWGMPVVANGRLFIRHGDVLTAYDVAAAQRNT